MHVQAAQAFCAAEAHGAATCNPTSTSLAQSAGSAKDSRDFSHMLLIYASNLGSFGKCESFALSDLPCLSNNHLLTQSLHSHSSSCLQAVLPKREEYNRPAKKEWILGKTGMRIVGVDPGQTDMVTYCVLGDHKNGRQIHR